MSVVLEIRRRGRQIAGSILGALIFLYFVLHAIQGDRGLLAWLQIRQQIAIANSELEISESKRNYWKRKISLLKSDSMNRDMLDERVRIVTGFMGKNELMILYRNDHK